MTRKLFIGFIAVLAMSLWFVGCTTDPAPDETPPVVTIDSPDQDDSMCDAFTVEGTARDVDPGLASVTLYVDGEEVASESFSDAASYDFEFDVSAGDFPATCGEVEIEVVATDGEGNEASEKVDVILCNDTTDPVVTLTPATSEVYNDQSATIEVSVTEPNTVGFMYRLNGGNWVEGSTPPEYIVFDDLNVGDNTVEFIVTDYCGNEGTGTATITRTMVGGDVAITFPAADECLCGEVTFAAEASVRDMPEIAEVQFFFDGEDVPRYSDATAPYEWTVDVNDTFEPETHVVYAKAVLTDGTESNSESVSWVKSCDPHAVIQVTNIDHCNRMVTVSAALSSDDNVEPGLTFEFDAPTCAGNWTTNQIDPSQSIVTFTFDTETCGYGDYDISVTVYDGWCDGMDTATITVTLVDDCTGDLAFTDPTAVDVYGDSEATWPLAVNATDRLVDPAITQVDFYYDADMTLPPAEPNFGMLCSATEGSGDTWGCDFDSADLPAVGGWYYFHAMSTDNAVNSEGVANVNWATPELFWKSDMPTALNLTEEHADGNYYDNEFLTLPFTVVFTDDNLADTETTYDVVFDFSDGGHYVVNIGTLDPGTAGITHTFAGLGSYSLEVYIVEYTPVDSGRNVTVTSLTETWSICLEDDLPVINAFNVENITFIADEGPYDNDWVNPNDFLVSDEREDLGSTFDADDVDVGNCVSGCDYFTIDFAGSHYVAPITVACGETYQNINWDAFDAGDWDVTFTIYDKAGNMAQMMETVTKSDYPDFSTLAFYTNEWPYDSGVWNCFEDPVGIPVRFYDWNSTDDSGYPLDSLLFEFVSSDGTNVWTEELFGYNPNTFPLPWVYWFDHYDDMTARIWSCDVWGQWSVSEDFEVNLQDVCAPEQPEIDEVDDFFNPGIAITNAWDRADVQSSDTDIHIEFDVDDRTGESGPFGHSGPEVDRIEIIAFDVADGYGGDPTYWTDMYGFGYDGDGTSAYTGVIATLNGDGPGDAVWDADGAFYGICGFFYVYAQAVDVNGNRSLPSFPVVIYKYSLPEFADCDETAVDAELCMSVTMECADDAEYTYDWNFGDGTPVVVDGGNSQCHTFTLAALRTVSVDYYIDGNYVGTTETWVSVGDEQDPWVTNLDVAPYHPIDAPNANEGNEGTKNAQYGTMYYDLTALDNGILQGLGGESDAAVTVEIWTDDDGFVGGSPGTFIEQVTLLYNPDCMDNEVEWRFFYNWDGKDRGYYWMRARAHDRSGNTGDYSDLQLFHSDPPGSAETGGDLEVIGDYYNLHTLEFAVNALVSDDGDPNGIKYQWDRRTDLRSSEDGDWWSDPGFAPEYEFSPPQDPLVWRLNYYEAGYGYNTPGDPYDPTDNRYGYRSTSSSTTSDGPAFRAVDEDGIYSQIVLFPEDIYGQHGVIIEDVAEPRLMWITPDCSAGNIDGNVTLTVWASDYPEYNRDGLPGISKVWFLVNDLYIDEDVTGVDVGMQEIDGLTGPTFEFSITFDVSAFLDAAYGYAYGGPAIFEARAFDINEDQVGQRDNNCVESNDPTVVAAGACDLISGSQVVVFPFQNYISDDNEIDYIEVNFGDGAGWWFIDWPNATNYAYNYGAWDNWTVTVNVYDTAGDSQLGVVLSTDVWTDNVDPSADWAAGTPANGATCVTADYPDNIDIMPSNVADNSGCLDRVEFYLSDNGNPGTYEYYFTATSAPWNFPWYPYDQESKDIYVGIRVYDQAGNSFDFGIDDGSVQFEQDLKPWNPSIDHPEVWALLNATVELYGAGENDVNDDFDCAWDYETTGTKDDTTNPISEAVDPVTYPSGVAGDFLLTMGLEDDCWDYNGGLTNTTTADIHIVDDVPPTITDNTVDPVDTRQATIDFDVQDIDGNGNCWWWDYATLNVYSNPEADLLHEVTFYSAYQWNPTWPTNVSYEDPCFYGSENFTYTFDVGGFADCDGPIGDVYVDSDGFPLGYNPYENLDIVDYEIEAFDTEGNSSLVTDSFTINDILAPEAPADPAYWIYPEPNATIVAGTPITVQVRPLDWHCATITDVEFFADEPAYDYASVNMDNFFGADTDADADGIFEATTVLAVGNHTIGIFAWDDVVNESQQWFINITVVAP